MNAKILIPAIVLSLAAALAAGILIPLATGAEAGYARLTPSPAVLTWEYGDEHTLWLSTNRHGAELRFSGLTAAGLPALGQGALQVRDNGSPEPLTLGRAGGCAAAYDLNDDAGTPDDPAADFAYSAYWMEQGTGVGLIACADSLAPPTVYQGTVALYDRPAPEGVELTSYTFEITPVATAATGTRPPAFDDGVYTTRQICVDAVGARAGYLSGGELAGAAVAATDPDTGDTLVYVLESWDGKSNYFYFDIDPATGQISVAEAGANDSSGLNSDAVYAVAVRARDNNGASAVIDVGIQLNATTTSDRDIDGDNVVDRPGDGICP